MYMNIWMFEIILRYLSHLLLHDGCCRGPQRCVVYVVIIRSTCNSRDTLLAEALIYRLRGHYVGLRRKSGLIRYIRAL